MYLRHPAKIPLLAMPPPAGSTCALSFRGRGVGGRRPFVGGWGVSIPCCVLAAKAKERSLVYQCLSTSNAASFCKMLPFFFNGFLLLIVLKMHLHCLSDPHTWSQPLQPLPWLLLHFPKPLHCLGPLIFPPAPMFYALVMPPFLLINFSHYLACPCCPLLFNLLLTSHHNPWASL